MATIVNNPGSTGESNGMGFVMGLVLLLAFVFVIFYWGLPAMRGANTQPATPSVPSVQVPEKIDVNINQPDAQPQQ